MEGDGASILAAGLDKYLTKPLRKSAITDGDGLALSARCLPDHSRSGGLGHGSARENTMRSSEERSARNP